MRAGRSSCGFIRSCLNLTWNHCCHQLGEENSAPADTFNEWLFLSSLGAELRIHAVFARIAGVDSGESRGCQGEKASKGSPVPKARVPLTDAKSPADSIKSYRVSVIHRPRRRYREY